LLERIGEINNRLQRLCQSDREIGVLRWQEDCFAGAIAVAILPILTRLYTLRTGRAGRLQRLSAVLRGRGIKVRYRIQYGEDEDAVEGGSAPVRQACTGA